MYGLEDIAELALQDLANYESDPENYSPPWAGSLDGWRRSASEAGDFDTIECIDTVPDALEIFEQAGERLRQCQEFGTMRRALILALLVGDERTWAHWMASQV